jgi:hypothetical protein
MIYISPLSRSETGTKSQVQALLEEYDADVIVIDEYTWLKDDQNERDVLAEYLSAQSRLGKSVIITGTDSTRMIALGDTYFLHHAININTNYCSYDEYCRLYASPKNIYSMNGYLLDGGIFQDRISRSYTFLRDYIQSAILDDFVSCYQCDAVVKTAVYTIFYDCVKKLCGDDKEMLDYEDYLEQFGCDLDICVPASVMREVSNKLQDIGVLVEVKDLRIPEQTRTYITSQMLLAQLIKSIYGEISTRNMGLMYETSVVCNVYMKKIYGEKSPYTIRYLHGRFFGKEQETVFIRSDSDHAYLFECKYTEEAMEIADDAAIVKSIIPNLLGDVDVIGRFIFYCGKNRCGRVNGVDLLYTNDWNVNLSDFSKTLAECKNCV